MQIKSYEGAVKYLEGFIGKIIFKVDPSSQYDPLERMRVLLSFIGDPQNKFPSVLIGGTSGKSSTAYLLSHILKTSGYKVGFTISPHLQKVNERLQINNQPISDDKFVKLLKSSILPSIREMSKMEIGAPSYFEILIGMAFKYFADQKVDIAVVEVGMGGEFDATNTLNPLIAILTNVGLDHTNILGKTVEKIARTKAGIIKKNLVVVTGVKQPSVIKIVEERCEKVGAKLLGLGKDFSYKIKKESFGGSIFDLTTARGRGLQLNNLELTLLGNYQIENASLAIETVLELKKLGFKVADEAIKKALKTAFFPGRFEIINYTLDAKRYTLVLDGAHNPTKMKEFLKSLEKIFPKQKKVFIVGFKFDKDIKKMLREILGVADEIIVTEFKAKTDMNIHASADALKLKSQISSLCQGFGRQAKLKKVMVEKDSKKALEKALKMQPEIIVVTGSLYLVGEIRNML